MMARAARNYLRCLNRCARSTRAKISFKAGPETPPLAAIQLKLNQAVRCRSGAWPQTNRLSSIVAMHNLSLEGIAMPAHHMPRRLVLVTLLVSAGLIGP